jgi:ATF/CREB family transcription factor
LAFFLFLPSLTLIAALKCRQRKKQWLNNLQAKVEFFAQENDALSHEINELRGEVIQLKTILYTHRDCPHSRSQLQSGVMDQIARDLERAGVIGMAMKQINQQQTTQNEISMDGIPHY